MALKFDSIKKLNTFITQKYSVIKPKRYIERQFIDISKFGTAKEYNNVPAEIVEKYTPFRRLSKKTCKLSDTDYFIKKFEKESPNEFPPLWSKMNNSEKIDFIVKNRYERLVSNKIMNSLKTSRTEKSFGITTDGKIAFYDTINSSRHCPTINNNKLISIHNHPIQFGSQYSQIDYQQINKNSHSFSCGDIINGLDRPKNYVVDMHRNKFMLIPNKTLQKRLDFNDYRQMLADDLEDITMYSYNNTDNIADAIKLARNKYIERIKKDGHTFKFLNLFSSQ